MNRTTLQTTVVHKQNAECLQKFFYSGNRLHFGTWRTGLYMPKIIEFHCCIQLLQAKMKGGII